MLRRDFCVAVDFGSLTGETGATPGSDVTRKMRPDITGGNEAASSTDARMSQIMDVMENQFTKRLRNEGAEVAGGNVAMKRNVTYLMLGMLEGGRMEQLLSLRTRDLLLSQLKRGKRGAGGGWKRRKKWANRLRRRKRGVGKNIISTLLVLLFLQKAAASVSNRPRLNLLSWRRLVLSAAPIALGCLLFILSRSLKALGGLVAITAASILPLHQRRRGQREK